MKNFDKYIIEKLKVSKNKQLTLGDIYRISNISISAAANMEPEALLEKIDDVLGINKLYKLQNEYTDNTNPKIKNEEVKKLCKIILNIIFSVPVDMSIYDGLEQLMDDCNVPYYERDLFHIEDNSKLLFTNYLLVYFKFEER